MMHFISVHFCVPADLTVRRTEVVSVNPRHHRHSRKSHSAALAVAEYRQSERECVSELRAGRGGASSLHNNIGASETVEGRENAAEAGSRPSVADSGREGKRRFLTSFFWILPAPFCFAFFFFHSAAIPLCLALRSLFSLSYISTCIYLCLSCSYSPMAT